MNHQIHSNKRIDKVQKDRKKTDLENRIYAIISMGTIISGIITCFASYAIGLSLIFLGGMVLYEVQYV